MVHVFQGTPFHCRTACNCGRARDHDMVGATAIQIKSSLAPRSCVKCVPLRAAHRPSQRPEFCSRWRRRLDCHERQRAAAATAATPALSPSCHCNAGWRRSFTAAEARRPRRARTSQQPKLVCTAHCAPRARPVMPQAPAHAPPRTANLSSTPRPACMRTVGFVLCSGCAPE